MIARAFSIDRFQRVSFSDRGSLEPRLFASPERSCEFTFGNLLNWGGVSGTYWQEYRDLICIWLKAEDQIVVAESPGEIEPDVCQEISDEMRANGFSGAFGQIREETLTRRPELFERFEVAPAPEKFGEYFYETETLAFLRGKKLSPKRNLVAQFKRLYPRYRTEPATLDNIGAIRETFDVWRDSRNDEDESLREESETFERVLRDFPNAGFEGLAVLVDDQVAAFTFFARTSADVWDVAFAKADFSFKGATVLAFSETANSLLGKARWINLEDDAGAPGLRQMKRSFSPSKILRNYTMKPKN